MVEKFFGPPPSYRPEFKVPPANLTDIKFATSPAGREFIYSWFSRAEEFSTLKEWLSALYIFSLSVHYQEGWDWSKNAPEILKVYEIFCAKGFAEKGPVALYWPNALAPLSFFYPEERIFVDLLRKILLVGDQASRVDAARSLCLARVKQAAIYVAKAVMEGLFDRSALVRAEAIFSLIKCGYIPSEAGNLLVEHLDHPTTCLPAAGALFRLTGNESYFSILQEAASSRVEEVAAAAAYALEPWPTRLCSIKRCRAPIQFQHFWIEWRKVNGRNRLEEAYQIWQTPSVDFVCCHCFTELDLVVDEKNRDEEVPETSV